MYTYDTRTNVQTNPTMYIHKRVLLDPQKYAYMTHLQIYKQNTPQHAHTCACIIRHNTHTNIHTHHNTCIHIHVLSDTQRCTYITHVHIREFNLSSK